MRLACENCLAPYIIDDAAMTARGVRAQCPRCKNIQYVPPAVNLTNPAARAQAMAKPISESRPPVPGREDPEIPTQVARVTLATRMVTRPPSPPPEALEKEGHEARAELFGELDWNDGEPADGEGAAVPGTSAMDTPLTTPRAVAPPGPPPPPTVQSVEVPANVGVPSAKGFSDDELFGEQPPVEDKAPQPTGSCASCGEALLSLEDVASGVCRKCREAAAARLAPPLEVPVFRSPGATPRRTPPIPRVASPEPRRWGMLAALAAVVVLGLSSVVWLRTRGGTPLPTPAPRPVRRIDPLAPLPTGLAERLATWRTAADNAAQPTALVLVEAQREIALDQPAAYASAARRLERALVDAPRDPELLGAWLTATALGRGATMDAAEYASLVQLAESAATASQRAPAVLLGLAELVLAGPGPGVDERARSLAQEALGSDPNSAQAHLVLARTYVRTSAELALGELQKAELADPSQRRIPLVRAEAYATSGEPRGALAALQARLALEPNHAASLFATGRLLVEVGESDQARRLFERLQSDPRTEDGPALFELALLDSLQGRPREAVQLLRAALKRGRLTPQGRLRSNVLMAAAERAAGEPAAAAAAARAALALQPNDAGAHLQLLLLALDRGDGAAADGQLPYVVGKLGDPGLEGMLEGWVRMAQKQPALAAEVFARTALADPRRTDAFLWGAAAQAKASNRAAALPLLAAAEEADPTRAGPFSPLSELSVRPEEYLRGAEAPLTQLSHGASDARPLVGEAVLRFHRRDFAGAEAALSRALKLDAAQPQALAWRALLLLERGDIKEAAVQAHLAQQTGRSLPVVAYAAGVVALASGDLDAARKSLREVSQMAPTQLAAQVRLAEAEARGGAVAAARERLRKVVQIDPSYASAKRALYLLPKES